MPQRILDSLLEGFQWIGADWRYRYVNEAAARHGRTTPERLFGRTMMEAYPGIERTEVFRLIEDCMTRRIRRTLENEFTYPDGEKRWFELRIQPAQDGVVIFSLDIEERRAAAVERERLERQLRETQKMDAIGRLAGGVAHDFNNLLAVVLSYAECAIEAAGAEAPIRGDLLEIRSAATRAAALSRQLLAVSCRQVSEPTLLDVNAVITSMSEIAKRVLPPSVAVELRLDPELGAVRVDPTQIEQVLLNLIVNARDAMPDGGRLTIATTNVELNADSAREVQVKAGRFVALTVSDTGCGMSPETQARIFEPFFTTKGDAKGAGLGLSIVYGIVHQFGGHIWVYSEPGQGSTFRIYLPRQYGTAPRAPHPRRAKVVGGDESVLVVEDCVAIRAVIERALTNAGYTVAAVASAEEAQQWLERSASPPQLLVTDVELPGRSGPEFAGDLTQRFRDLRVLFMSGYGEDSVTARGRPNYVWRFIQKPFASSTLVAKARSTLDASLV